MKNAADALSMSVADMIEIAFREWWSSEPYLVCNQCGGMNLVEERTKLFGVGDDGCYYCGAEAFGLQK